MMSKINLTVPLYDAKLDEILNLLKSIGDVMATQADIDNLAAQLAKIHSEITAQVAALQAIIDAGQPVLDISALQAAVQGLDDMNPDAPQP